MARARKRWKRAQRMLDSTRLVFIDETAANTKMARLNGRCPRGERLIGRVPHGHWKTITFVGALRRRGMTAPFVTELASQDVVEIERSAGYAERLITRSIDRAGRE